MTTDWNKELKANSGNIYAQDGRWLKPKSPNGDVPDKRGGDMLIKPELRTWDGDVWCDPKEEIELSEYEQNFARFIDSVVAARYCDTADSARLNFILAHVSTNRAEGDIFDWKAMYIDRETRAKRPEDERTVCDAFGIAGRRTMSRLNKRSDIPRKTILEERLLVRMCWFSIARKVFLARIGHPEYCKPFVS